MRVCVCVSGVCMYVDIDIISNISLFMYIHRHDIPIDREIEMESAEMGDTADTSKEPFRCGKS